MLRSSGRLAAEMVRPSCIWLVRLPECRTAPTTSSLHQALQMLLSLSKEWLLHLEGKAGWHADPRGPSTRAPHRAQARRGHALQHLHLERAARHRDACQWGRNRRCQASGGCCVYLSCSRMGGGAYQCEGRMLLSNVLNDDELYQARHAQQHKLTCSAGEQGALATANPKARILMACKLPA